MLAPTQFSFYLSATPDLLRELKIVSIYNCVPVILTSLTQLFQRENTHNADPREGNAGADDRAVVAHGARDTSQFCHKINR